MPWCPKCVAEYKPETDTCPDCGAPLIDGFPGLAEGVIPSRQREIALSAVQSLMLSCLSIAILIALTFASVRLPQYLPQYGWFWDLMILGCAAPVCAAVGFVSGRLRAKPMCLSGAAIGWLIPWAVFLMLMLRLDPGWAVRHGLLPTLLMWSGYCASAALAGIVGTVLGAQWKQRRDWARMVAFCAVLAAFAYFWAVILDFMLVCRD